jgi:hypothetical protein
MSLALVFVSMYHVWAFIVDYRHLPDEIVIRHVSETDVKPKPKGAK